MINEITILVLLPHIANHFRLTIVLPHPKGHPISTIHWRPLATHRCLRRFFVSTLDDISDVNQPTSQKWMRKVWDISQPDLAQTHNMPKCNNILCPNATNIKFQRKRTYNRARSGRWSLCKMFETAVRAGPVHLFERRNGCMCTRNGRRFRLHAQQQKHTKHLLCLNFDLSLQTSLC